MTDDTNLRTECLALLHRFEYECTSRDSDLDVLVALCKRMQADGLREVVRLVKKQSTILGGGPNAWVERNALLAAIRTGRLR